MSEKGRDRKKRMLRFGEIRKLRKLMEFTGSGRDISDPWYSRRFDTAFDDITEGCTALLEIIDS